MANKPRDQVRREQEIIRSLIYDQNLSDVQIIEQLQIPERTLYNYKKRIKKNLIKSWEQEDNDRAQYTYANFNRTLEYCYRETKKIIDNPNTSAHDRVEAIKTLAVLASQIARLAKDGPVFTPQLPVIVQENAQEVTV